VFERFSEHSRQVVVRAQDEARRFGHDWIGSEHLLAALAGEGAPAAALEAAGLDLDRLRVEVVRLVGQGEPVSPGQIPFTPTAKGALEAASQEADGLGSSQLLPEHLLLGVLAQRSGTSARILRDCGTDVEVVLAALGVEVVGDRSRFVPAVDAAPDSRAQSGIRGRLRMGRRDRPDAEVFGKEGGPFQRFTGRAREVVVLAQDEARALKHNYIGTEHILLGLLREEEGLAARVLESLDITVEGVRAQVARIVGQADEVTTGQIPFTPRAKKVLELALREALSLGHNYIGTEHILLGLVRENEGVAARILLDFDADAEKIRNEIIRMLSSLGRRQEQSKPLAPRELTSPPVAREVLDELAHIEQERETAIAEQRFQAAAELTERESALVHVARELQAAWEAHRDQP
jgi:ATP-dependent Clp protease ATP-binding subunit ClpA